MVRKNSRSTSSAPTPRCRATASTNPATPSDRVGPASTEFTVTPVPAVVSASPRASPTCAIFVTP